MILSNANHIYTKQQKWLGLSGKKKKVHMVLTKVKKQAASQAASTLQPQHRLSRVGPTAPLDSFKTWLEKDTEVWSCDDSPAPSRRMDQKSSRQPFQQFNEPIIILNLLTFELVTVKLNALWILTCIIILVSQCS